MPKVTYGGPYIHESEKIQKELQDAKREDREPKLEGLFDKEKEVSQGALNLLDSYLNHPAAVTGPFVNNVKLEQVNGLEESVEEVVNDLTEGL